MCCAQHPNCTSHPPSQAHQHTASSAVFLPSQKEEKPKAEASPTPRLAAREDVLAHRLSSTRPVASRPARSVQLVVVSSADESPLGNRKLWPSHRWRHWVRRKGADRNLLTATRTPAPEWRTAASVIGLGGIATCPQAARRRPPASAGRPLQALPTLSLGGPCVERSGGSVSKYSAHDDVSRATSQTALLGVPDKRFRRRTRASDTPVANGNPHESKRWEPDSCGHPPNLPNRANHRDSVLTCHFAATSEQIALCFDGSQHHMHVLK